MIDVVIIRYTVYLIQLAVSYASYTTSILNEEEGL